jgi:CMP-N-acetylneuraminic acid synthetase
MLAILFSACCKTFYGELVEFMSRGAIVAAILEKDNAVEDFRTLIGATNPADAAEGTIRKAYATLLEKMQFTVLTVMKMQLSKVLSFCRKRAVLILVEDCSQIQLNLRFKIINKIRPLKSETGFFLYNHC